MNEIKIFENTDFGSVRTLEENGKVLFCATDIANALGYSNPRDAIAKHCRCVAKCDIPHPQSTEKQIEMSFIPEGDVYRLITHSKLPSAEKFESWVFDEVLPDIRKHGVYMTPAVIEQTLMNPDYIIQLATTLKEEHEKNNQLSNTIAVKEQQIAELQPKASYYDVVLNCKDLMSITEIAKDYGKSGRWLNDYLHEKGVQFKQGNIWLLYQRYAQLGYTSTKTQTFNGNDGRVHTKVHTYWTQKGRLFIYDLLKADGIVPIIERAA